MKLKTKIQLFSSLFMLVLILLVNTSIYFLFYKITSDSELEQLAEQTNLLVETLAENPDINENEMSELIYAYLPANGMAKVFPKEGKLIEWLYKGENAYNTLKGEFSTMESQSIVTPKNGVSVAVISKPIIWNNGEIVTLQISNNLIDFRETMTTLFYVLVVASVIMLIPSIIAGVLLSRFLLNPIKKLIQTMKENTKHAKWQKIDVENRSKDELYEMEKTFNEMIDYLKDNFEKQEIFVSDASHELKTPISIVKSYAQLLKRRGTDNQELVKESMDAIDSEADRMKKLVEQMLALAKNKQKDTMEKIDFTALGEETVQTFKGAYSRNISLNTDGQLFVYGNKDQLEQVTYILVDNALKYSDKEIDISIMEENDEALFIVKDYGKGIPEEETNRIFERFYRVDKARSRDTGGTGLGLAIAKAIAVDHHGELSVSSRLGEGSSFILKLPNSQ